ncbi:MAG: transcriptional regulator [Rariglobus sp.]|jgi:DNA-binding transcriptional regulator GbsR (MarR family)|nr:transcriptional regulator [Rariglobus sp.]
MEAESTSSFPPDPALEEPVDTPAQPLTPAKLRMIEHWVQLADSLGLPKSLAQLYGFIFTSKKPVSAQDCVDALKISRSSAGQGLKALRDIGAIRSAFELGARREAFVIEPDLGVVIQGMLNGRVVPAFDIFFTQIASIEQSLDPHKDHFLTNRVQKLHRWRTKLGRIKKWLLR